MGKGVYRDCGQNSTVMSLSTIKFLGSFAPKSEVFFIIFYYFMGGVVGREQKLESALEQLNLPQAKILKSHYSAVF